jgi:hypothetical protein
LRKKRSAGRFVTFFGETWSTCQGFEGFLPFFPSDAPARFAERWN